MVHVNGDERRVQWAAEHARLMRRYFLRVRLPRPGAAAVALERPRGPTHPAALAALVKDLRYLTPEEDFTNVERGNPLAFVAPAGKASCRRADARDLEPGSRLRPRRTGEIGRPLSKEAGTALDWAGLMKLAEKHAVRFLKVMTCNNIGTPLGMGLWEGVPLRTVVWLTRPTGDLRRVFYYGYHNNDPKQLFQSSLPIGRVLEVPPGEYPVILCYKVNGDWLSGHRGGPVRMLVPECYGFKSVKWLKRVVLSNGPFANDTYAHQNNDIDSSMKTFARFLSFPSTLKTGQPLPVTGAAQVGMSGLSKVQCWITPPISRCRTTIPTSRRPTGKTRRFLGLPPPGVGEAASRTASCRPA